LAHTERACRAASGAGGRGGDGGEVRGAAPRRGGRGGGGRARAQSGGAGLGVPLPPLLLRGRGRCARARAALPLLQGTPTRLDCVGSYADFSFGCFDVLAPTFVSNNHTEFFLQSSDQLFKTVDCRKAVIFTVFSHVNAS
jgi:hypothetical protein